MIIFLIFLALQNFDLTKHMKAFKEGIKLPGGGSRFSFLRCNTIDS